MRYVPKWPNFLTFFPKRVESRSGETFTTKMHTILLRNLSFSGAASSSWPTLREGWKEQTYCKMDIPLADLVGIGWFMEDSVSSWRPWDTTRSGIGVCWRGCRGGWLFSLPCTHSPYAPTLGSRTPPRSWPRGDPRAYPDSGVISPSSP